MLTIVEETNKELLAVRVSGKLTSEDFELYKQQIADRMALSHAARLYFEMTDFDGWEPGSFLENAFFDLVNGREYGRVAMVGNKKWQKWAAQLASPVKKEGVHYFHLTDKESAMRWVQA